ncbi:MAG: hypothetical protein MUC92_01280 [Fimbriimonadaceae bacterium]|jgi:hypothetical protein|nr:hypothetical protein [Fimbriimonadaceae bacterium]
MTKRIITAAAGLLALTPCAFAQGNNLGLEYGIFFPSDSNLRKALGDQWVSFGLGRVGTPRANRGRDNLQSNLNFISKDANGNRIFLAAYSLGVTRPLGGDDRGMRGGQVSGLFFSLRGGIAYQDYAVTLPGGRRSGKKIGFNGNAELGYALGQNFVISARYDIFSEADGLRFDGLSLSVAYGLFRF